ncbi:MAG: SulP family inorganic anion transporter [Bacillota bacterium]|nr:SulP family inorganic anion transporter [Bacillota bacterium]
MNYQALSISILSLLTLLILPKINKKIPPALVVLLLSSFVVKFFQMDVLTIGGAFENLSSSLPLPAFPNLRLEMMEKMFMPALAIALLGSIESLLSAVVADGMISGRHRSNTELIAQGIANMASSIFGGMPATGAIARTVANINSGATSPIAGMVHAVSLLIIMLLFMPLAKTVPLSALSAILVVVALNMGEWRVLRRILSAPKSDAIILFTVFLITIMFDLVLAIEIGMVLAAFLFMKRMADMTQVKVSSFDFDEDAPEDEDGKKKDKQGSGGHYVYEINGPFFFGAAHKFINTLHRLDGNTKSLVVRMRYVNSVDATAVHAFKRLIGVCKDNAIDLILCELNEQPRKIFRNTGVLELIGEERVYESFEQVNLQITKA